MKKEDGVFVIDSLANIGNYAGYGVHFAKAVEFLQRKDLKTLPVGRYELDGTNVYAMVQDVQLKAWGSARPEVHHAYYDIQLPLTGEEVIGIGRFDPATPGEFDEEKDYGLYDVAVEPETLSPGQFAIFDPRTCAHAPCCSHDGGGALRKIVVKIRQ